MRRGIKQAMAVVLAGALAACGGGSNGDGSTQTQTADVPSTVVATTADEAVANEVPTAGPVEGVLSRDDAGTLAEGDAEALSGQNIEKQALATIVGGATQSVNAVTTSDATTDITHTFDSAFTVLAPGWRINWWGNGTPSYRAARETRSGYVYSGASSQSFRLVTAPSDGAAHLVFPASFTKGAAYTVSLYLRSEAPTVVDVMLRRDTSPWNLAAVKRVTLTSTWQRVDISGIYAWSDPGSVRIAPLATNQTIYLDQMTIRKTSGGTTSTPPASGGLSLPLAGPAAETLKTVKQTTMDGDFTRFDPGWYYNAIGGTSTPEFLASRESRGGYYYAGGGAQRFQVINKHGGDVHLTSSFPFVKGRTYRATMYMRADGSVPVLVWMRRDEHPWDAFASKRVTLGSAWQKVEIEGTYIGDADGTLRIGLLNGTGTVYVDQMTIAEVDRNEMKPYATGAIADSLFGMHVNKLGTHHNWPGMSTHILRLHNTATHWRDLQPAAGQWSETHLQRIDDYLDYAQAAQPGAQVLLTLGITPQWASSTPTVQGLYGLGASGAPKNTNDWRVYVRTLAQRFKGRIHHWELWNEPDFKPHWNGTNAQMIELARIAREELLAADPSNKLVGPGFTAGQGMAALDSLLASGLAPYIDIVGYHFYYSTNPEVLVAQLDNVRGLMKNYGIAGKPLWITEGAFVCNSAVSDCDTATPTSSQRRSVNARALLVMAAKGVQNFNFYVYEASDPYRQLVESDYLTKTEAGRAYSEVRGWMQGTSLADAYTLDDKVYVVHLKRNGSDNVVLWAPGGATTVNVPSGWAVSRTRTITGAEGGLPANRQISVGSEPMLLKP